MKKLAGLAAIMLLLLCTQAFAASNMDKLHGTWQCDAQGAIAALGDMDEDPMVIAMLTQMLESFRFQFDTKAKTMTVFMGPQSDTGTFKVISDKGNTLTIEDQEGAEVRLEFKGKDSMMMIDPEEEGAPIPFVRVKE